MAKSQKKDPVTYAQPLAEFNTMFHAAVREAGGDPVAAFGLMTERSRAVHQVLESAGVLGVHQGAHALAEHAAAVRVSRSESGRATSNARRVERDANDKKAAERIAKLLKRYDPGEQLPTRKAVGDELNLYPAEVKRACDANGWLMRKRK